MRLLLDTHVWLWLQQAPERLGAALPVVEDRDNELLLSAASSWEMAIKSGLGKLRLPSPPAHYVLSRLTANGITPLAVQHRHALAVADLPHHHRDPFDRLLIVQAIQERATLVTADPAVLAYDVATLWAGD